MATLLPRNPLISTSLQSKTPRLPRKTGGSAQRTSRIVAGSSRGWREDVTAGIGIAARPSRRAAAAQDDTTHDIDRQTASNFELAYSLTAAQLLEVPDLNQNDPTAKALPSRRRDAEFSGPNDQGMLHAAFINQQLQDRVDMVLRKQDAWYSETLQQSRLVDSTSRELFLQTKEQRDQRMRQELEAYQQWMEQIQVERQARLAEEAEEQRLALEHQRVLEAAEEALRAHLAAEEEQVRRERERECAVCLEANDMRDMVEVPCGHWYCPDHLRDAIQAGYRARMPFHCCRTIVPIDNLREILPADFYNHYYSLLEERLATNPIYCSNRRCGAFVPESAGRGPDLIECSLCGSATCRHCRNQSHPWTECAADVGTQQARSLATAQGWKSCPNCTNMVEKSSGCIHMTCRCGTEFCYRCGQLYSRCQGTCRARQ